MVAHIVKRAESMGWQVTVLAHRQELVKQISRALSRHSSAFVSTVQTVWKRTAPFTKNCRLLILDEAHHSAAKQWTVCIEAFKQAGAKVLGVTATPERFDGKPLGGLFDAIVRGPDVGELVDGGHLVPLRVFVPAEIRLKSSGGSEYSMKKAGDELKRGLVEGLKGLGEHYRRFIFPRPALAFCCTLDHAQEVCKVFQQAGVSSLAVSGKSSPSERRDAVEAVRQGRVNVVCNCELWTEGVDLPSLGGCILLRPTKSVAMYLQMVGRAMRLSAGKDHGIILDYVGNTRRHGLPTQSREWSLEGRKKRGGARSTVKTCGFCFLAVPISAEVCPYCGSRFHKETRKKKIAECYVRDFSELMGAADADEPVLAALGRRDPAEVQAIFRKTRNLSLAHACAKVLNVSPTKAWYTWRMNCGF